MNLRKSLHNQISIYVCNGILWIILWTVYFNSQIHKRFKLTKGLIIMSWISRTFQSSAVGFPVNKLCCAFIHTQNRSTAQHRHFWWGFLNNLTQTDQMKCTRRTRKNCVKNAGINPNKEELRSVRKTVIQWNGRRRTTMGTGICYLLTIFTFWMVNY